MENRLSKRPQYIHALNILPTILSRNTLGLITRCVAKEDGVHTYKRNITQSPKERDSLTDYNKDEP